MRYLSAPVLGVPGISVRPIGLADAESWYGYLALPHVVEHTSWNLASAQDLRPVIAWCNSDDPASAIRFAVLSEPDGALVGTLGFHTISPAHSTAELSYDLHPSFWGRGLGTACCRAGLAWGFAQRGYVRVQATVLDTNVRSIRVLAQCGFAREGKLRSYRMVRGEPRDFWLYAALAGDGPAGA